MNTVEKQKKFYSTGSTTIMACKSDPRFSYCMYVPETLNPIDGKVDLLVSVHGSGRDITTCRDRFVDFGDLTGTVILSPLFPAGVCGDGNPNGYKYITEQDIRYDLILLDMVEEATAIVGAKFNRFCMCGFSGGGHFTHRFLLLHPDKLKAVSIGAPGSVTQISDDYDFWVGTKNWQEQFGKPLDIESLKQVSIQMVVGALDKDTWEITHDESSPLWMEGANNAGITRIDRLNTLKQNFQSNGLNVTLVEVAGVAHDATRVAGHVKRFFHECLRGA